METIRLSNETRRQRRETVQREGTDSRYTVERVVRPGRRFVVACCIVLTAGLGFIAYRLASGRGGGVPAAPVASPSDVALVVRQNVVLVEDPVCNKPVDPSRTRFILKFNGQDIYFDSEECMSRFLSDPFKYGKFRINVTVTRPDGTSTTMPLPRPSSAASGAESPRPSPSTLEQGGSEENGGTTAPPDATPSLDSKPAPPTGGDAPSLDSPDSGSSGAPDPGGLPAPGPGSDAAPKEDSSPRPDDGGFTLPPTMETGAPSEAPPAGHPPTRTAPPKAKKKSGGAPSRVPATQAPPSTGDDPPSVEDPNM